MALNNSNPNSVRRVRWPLWVAAAIAVVVLLAAFMSRDQAVPVSAVAVRRGAIRSVISTNGKVEAVRNFEAHAPTSTTVKKIMVKEGDHVRQGQLLVQLDDAQARSQAARAVSGLRSSEADISAIQSGGNREEVLTLTDQLVKAQTDRDTAQRNLEAFRRLQQKGAASVAEVREAENQLGRSDADLKLLQQKQKDRYSHPEIARVEAAKTEAQTSYAAAEDTLRQLSVRAPFDGVVYSIPVRLGAYVNPGDLVLQEADLSKVLIRAFVDEPDVGRLAAGQQAEVTWDALPDRVWKGVVNTVPATVKLHGTRNVGETTCLIDNQDMKLLPNVNVGVTIIAAEHRDVLTLPREAVRQDDSRNFVYEVVNDRLRRRDVQTSISNLTQVEVAGGINENALVALTSASSKPLRDGLPVKVIR